MKICPCCGQPQEQKTNPEEIVNSVCRYYNIPVEDVKSKKRLKHLVDVRMYASVLLHERGLSLGYIGKELGGKHHSTIIHLFKRFSDYSFSEPSTKNDFQNLKAAIYGIN